MPDPVTPPSADEIAAWQATCYSPGLSPGPWFVNPRTERICHGAPDDDRDNYPIDNPDDDDFICLARTALPRLLAHVEALERERDALRAALKPLAEAAFEWDNIRSEDWKRGWVLIEDLDRARAALAGRGGV